MDATTLRPETTEERIVWHRIVWTWFYWFLGALYVLAPVLAWCLFAMVVRRVVRGESGWRRERPPAGVVVWTIGMLAMLAALVIAHLDYGLGAGMLIKSTIGWAKGWALMFVFPFAGAMLKIRASIVYRATNKLALQTLCLVPVFILAAFADLPHPLYTSPLQIVGGPGPEYFAVELYGIDDTNGAKRWRFFAPWSPAAAFVANIAFVFALYDRSRFWKWIGIVSSIVVCLMSASRIALVVVPGVLGLTLALGNLTRPVTAAAGAVAGTIGGFALPAILAFVEQLTDRFNSARADSTRVRAYLRSIALHRWQTEAPLVGHGIVERGPKIVEYMPIGSHHTWYGLLYVKGLVGLLALLVPMLWTWGEMIVKAQSDRVARAGLSVITVITFYTFGENLEILAYLFWPGLVVIGIAMQRRFYSPYRQPLSGVG